MLTKALKKMEKEVMDLSKNFDNFARMGVFSSLTGSLDYAAVKIDLQTIMADIGFVYSTMQLDALSSALTGGKSLIELADELRDKQKHYENMKKRMKLPLTKNQREKLANEIEVCKQEGEQLYKKFFERCEKENPCLGRIVSKIQKYREESDNILKQIMEEKAKKNETKAR